MDIPVAKGSRRRRRDGQRKTRDADDTVVMKDAAPVHTTPSVPAPVVSLHPKRFQPIPKVILSPAKKKTPKVMLVPKGKTVVRHHVADRHKTFRAKRVKVTIDNTAKTQKHRRTMIAKVDALTDDQIRAAAVRTGLSRHETVGKAPIELLRQMVRDYQTMKGSLL